MIFRTINADAKKLTEQFGLLNKSFRDIKKDFANGLGFKNSLFQTSISKTDYQALQKFNSAIKVTNDGLTKSQRITKAWNENMTGCSIAAKRMGNDLVTGKKNIQDISKEMDMASGSTKALGVAMNVMANVGFMLAITAITKVISELAQAQENAIQAAKEATEAYKSELDSIADYKQRLSELHEELKSGNLSYKETKTKRTELMTIQDELIKKFGTEEDAIKSVTDAVNGQVDALDNLNEKSYRDWVAKADHESIWTQLLPWGKSGLDKAIDYMESKKTVSFNDMQNANLSDELQAIQKEIDETIRAKYNLDKTFAMFNVTGTPDELRTQLENIRQDYADFSKEVFDRENIPDKMWEEYRKETIDSINEAILSLDKGLEKHQDTYRTYIEGLIKYDSEYSDEYANILQKRAELESAQNSGNAEEVKKAKQEFMDSINDAIIASNSNENIKKYFESLYPELQAEFDDWAFEFDLTANVKGLGDTAKEIGEKYTATDLLNMVNTEGVQEGEESFNSLIDKAIEYGVCTDKSAEEVQKLIDLLVELGIVQDKVKGDTFKDKNPISFKEAWQGLDKDPKNDILELAQAGALTVEKFNGMKGAAELLEKTGLTAEQLTKKINNLASSASQLASMGNGIKSLSENLASKKESPKKSINYDTLAGMPEELKECTAAWKNYEKVMGTASSTYDECCRATNKLAAAFINSNNFLANLTNSTKDYYISQLQAMGISNAEAIVTAMLTQKHMEAAEAKQIESAKNEVLAITKNGVTNETLKEVNALFQQQGATKSVQYAIVDLIAQEQILSNTTLGVDDKIQQLRLLAETYYGTAAAADFMRQVQTSADGALSSGETAPPGKAWENVTNTHKPKKSKTPKVPEVNIPAPTISPTNYSTPKPSSSGDKGKSAKAKESRQEIDWLSRKLDTLQNKVDLLKTKFENLFSIGSKKNNLNQQIKQTEKLLKAQEKAASRYQKVADTYYKKNQKKLSKNGITLSMLQNGSYDVKSYKSGIAQIIQAYEDYYDKAQESKKATWELAATIKDLSKQKLDLKLEDNERKRTYQEARYANATSAKEKHTILNKEINTYKSDDKAYVQYYKESKKQLKKDGNTAKAAVNKTKELGKSAKDKIKKLIKQGKEIPSALMKKVKKHSTSAYQKLLEYNRGVDFVSDVLRDKKLAKEQNETNMREKRIERAQNYVDEAEAKYNLNQQYEANAVSAKDKNKYEAESLKYLNKQYDKLIKIAELEGDVTEKKRLQAEKQEKVNESYQKMYDNIKAEYDNKTGLNDARISTIQSEIATLEAAGKSVSKSLYDGMMKLNEGTKEKLLKERAELEEAGKNFKYGSEEWYAWQNDLEAINQGLYGCTQNTIEWKKALNELDFKKFKLMAAQLDATKSHLDFLVDMLSHKDLTEKESGGLTDAGFATISLRFANMENNAKIRENAQAELAKLHEDHINGEDFRTEEEYLAYEKELEDTIRDTIAADADEKDAILDLVENAMQVQIDAIDELIEKKKKALATEKDLYSYQQKVAKQTKNIALIQKQIAALSGDHSEEARAKVQKLQASLEEAQEDLKDTEYDRWHSDQEDMLDNLADEVEDFWERIMDDLKNNIGSSLDNILKMVTDNPDAVARALDELGLGDALSIITKYNPDGTHTNTAIDYGGNSYESTYDKDGDNVNNKFEEKYKEQTDGIHSDIKDLTDAADKLKDDAEKGTPWAEDAAQKAKDHAAATLLAQMKKKEEAILAADKRAEGILQQSAGGQKEFIVEDVPMEGVQGAVEKFLNSSALHKPTTEAGKKRMKADPLLKYIAENYNGKTLSNVNEARLGAYLGVPVKDINNVSKSEANKILKAFQGAGFANGGIASTLNKAAQENGDDGLITIQRGEAVLTKAQTEAVQDMADRFIHVGLPYTDEQLNMLRAHFNTPVDYSGMMPKYQNAPVNNANTSVSMGDINVHLDGSSVVDMESMFQQLNQPRNRQRMSECVLGDIKNPFQTMLKRF